GAPACAHAGNPRGGGPRCRPGAARAPRREAPALRRQAANGAADMSVVVRTAETPAERLAAWRIRERVFIGEQGIAEAIERDGLDDIAWHLVAWESDTAVGTARVVGIDGRNRPVPSAAATAVKIGRMAVLPSRRRLGIGRRLLDAALDLARQKGL